MSIAPPQICEDFVIFFSDGASRRSNAVDYEGSCGALLKVQNATIAKVAIFLHDVTNNVAEYEGVLCSFRHARTSAYTKICIRVDSMLIAQQLNGQWACRNPDLIPLYTEALDHLSFLRSASHIHEVVVEHIYREYNAEADSLANIAIDTYDSRIHRFGRVIWDGWLG